MTRFRFRLVSAPILFALAGCATMAGQPVAMIAEPAIAGAYLPLNRRIHLGIDRAAGAAMVIAPGVAVTNAHNANLLDPKSMIGEARDYDLLFFRAPSNAAPPTSAPMAGEAVSAYGQDTDGHLRIAHGVVREIVNCPGCSVPAYFTFAGDAGPGFSGGPVVDGQGRLVGITFGYKDQGSQRLIFAYDMARVRAEFSGLQNRAAAAKISQ